MRTAIGKLDKAARHSARTGRHPRRALDLGVLVEVMNTAVSDRANVTLEDEVLQASLGTETVLQAEVTARFCTKWYLQQSESVAKRPECPKAPCRAGDS